MSENWNDGYFTDSSYTYGYYRELSPQFLKLCLLLQGVAPPMGKNYCELGFGNGVSINIHASTGVESYYGTDFNPIHTTFAQRYAQSSENDAKLYNFSFQEFAQQPDLPMFDYITLHGIWSWIRPEVQKDIIQFIKNKLNPGGIVYVSYNTLPGWSTQQPLQKLLKLYDKHVNRKTDVHERVKDAFNFVKKLVAMPSHLSNALPNIKVYCDKNSDASTRYLAHEFFNDTLSPSYFDDIVQSMQMAKCDFACTASPKIRIQDINFSEEHRDFLNQLENPLLKEQIQDFLVFEMFRRDIYARGVTKLSISERWDLLKECRLILTIPLSKIELKITGHLGIADLSLEIYQPILNFFASEQFAPKTIERLHQHLPEHNEHVLTEAIIVLLSLDYIAPCQSEEDATGRMATAHKFNLRVAQYAQYDECVSYLASPVTNSGIHASILDLLFCWSHWMQYDNPVQWVFECIQKQQIRMIHNNVGIDSEPVRLKLIQEHYDLFQAERIPLFKALGIIQ